MPCIYANNSILVLFMGLKVFSLLVYVILVFLSWAWAEGATQPEVEEALGIGGFGYPVST